MKHKGHATIFYFKRMLMGIRSSGQQTIVSSFAWIDRQDLTVTGSWKSLNVNQLLYCKTEKNV
jgi:hypothetical protein